MFHGTRTRGKKLDPESFPRTVQGHMASAKGNGEGGLFGGSGLDTGGDHTYVVTERLYTKTKNCGWRSHLIGTRVGEASHPGPPSWRSTAPLHDDEIVFLIDRRDESEALEAQVFTTNRRYESETLEAQVAWVAAVTRADGLAAQEQQAIRAEVQIHLHGNLPEDEDGTFLLEGELAVNVQALEQQPNPGPSGIATTGLEHTSGPDTWTRARRRRFSQPASVSPSPEEQQQHEEHLYLHTNEYEERSHARGLKRKRSEPRAVPPPLTPAELVTTQWYEPRPPLAPAAEIASGGTPSPAWRGARFGQTPAGGSEAALAATAAVVCTGCLRLTCQRQECRIAVADARRKLYEETGALHDFLIAARTPAAAIAATAADSPSDTEPFDYDHGEVVEKRRGGKR